MSELPMSIIGSDSGAQRRQLLAWCYAVPLGIAALAGLAVCVYVGISGDPRMVDAAASPWASWMGVPLWAMGCAVYAATLLALGATLATAHWRQGVAWGVLWTLAITMLGVAAWHLGYVWPRVPLTPAHRWALALIAMTGILVIAASPSGVKGILPPSAVAVCTIAGVLMVGVLVGGQWSAATVAAGPTPEARPETPAPATPASLPGPAPCDILKELQEREGMDRMADVIPYRELRAGHGPYPRDGDIALVHYRSFLLDGTEVYSTYDKGPPEAWHDAMRLWKVAIYMRPGAKWRFAGWADLSLSEEELKKRGISDPVFLYEVELVAVRAGANAQTKDAQSVPKSIVESNLRARSQ